MEFIEELLLEEPYITKFQNYIYMPYNLWNKIPIGASIKYINKDLEPIFAGFLMKCINHARVEERVYVMKNNNKIFEFRPFFHYIFYKLPDELSIKQHAIIKTNNKRRIKKTKNIDLFKQMLSVL